MADEQEQPAHTTTDLSQVCYHRVLCVLHTGEMNRVKFLCSRRGRLSAPVVGRARVYNISRCA